MVVSKYVNSLILSSIVIDFGHPPSHSCAFAPFGGTSFPNILLNHHPQCLESIAYLTITKDRKI